MNHWKNKQKAYGSSTQFLKRTKKEKNYADF